MRTFRAILRFAAFVVLTFGIYALWWTGAFFVTGEKRKLNWRRFILRNWARGFVRIANLHLEIKGTPPEPPFLLVSNHLSYMDIAALGSVLECVFVAKADIEGWFTAGTMIRNVGIIYINRENRRDIPRAGAKIIKALERGEGVVVFAEGTTSNGSRVLPFKSSLLEFAAAQNLSVYYSTVSYETLPGEIPASESVCWWRPETDFASHVFELFKMPGFHGSITFGSTPIVSSNRKELAEKLHQAATAQFIPVK
ncbi:MAG: 1-acyl-sn-glycerol-3-phosphate acyltransferase [Acidobacteriota bacterium]|nr:1-acyl-sn-glycerol-3-phosphate acyltransferase [Acidobacteriota bacterium]